MEKTKIPHSIDFPCIPMGDDYVLDQLETYIDSESKIPFDMNPIFLGREGIIFGGMHRLKFALDTKTNIPFIDVEGKKFMIDFDLTGKCYNG